MSAPINDGGPAFPQHGWAKDPEVLARMRTQQGMTLRDHFAGQALAVLSAEKILAASIPSLQSATGRDKEWRDQLISTVAVTSFEIADAMLKARGGAS